MSNRSEGKEEMKKSGQRNKGEEIQSLNTGTTNKWKEGLI